MNRRVSTLWTRIMLSMTLLVVLVVSALGISSAVASYNEARDSMDKLHQSTCEAHVSALEEYLHMLLMDTASIAESGAITSETLTFEERQANIERIFSVRDDIASLYTVNSNGVAVNDATAEDIGENYASEPFFIAGMANDGGHIDVPYYDNWNDMVTMTVSYRLERASGFTGIVCVDVSYDTLHGLIVGSTLGETGYSFLVDQDGVIRSHPDEGLVVDEVGYNEYFGEDSRAAEALSTMLENDMGKSLDVQAGGEIIRLYSQRIPTTGWHYVSVIKVSEFTDNFQNQLMFIIAMALVCIAVAMLLAFVISRRLAKPITAMRRRMDLLAAGDLHTPLPEFEWLDEIGALYAAMEASLRSLSAYVADISDNMKKLAEGDLRTADKSEGASEYVGDFLPIKESMDNLKGSLWRFFKGTGGAARTIASTSAQMASASKELSNNTVMQAAAIDRIDKRFEDIKDSLVKASEGASETLKKANATRDEIESSNEEMGQMLAAMREIEATSRSVVKIVKDIDDIAFMSSILSLNAAIEAARAGVHGKGFSVVAGEVRDLAGKSAASAQYTEELVKGAITAVEKGMSIAESTFEKIDKVCHLLDSVAELIESIETTVAKQAEAADGIYADLTNLNALVHNDTAMSEETSSASIELSQRMGLLYRELEFFKTDE